MREDLAFLKQSKTAIQILKKLNSPKTPTEIGKELNLHQQSVSNTLSKLLKRKLVICVTPERHNYRHYEITEKGRKLLKKIE